MRSGSGVVTSFLKFWEQSIKFHGEGCYEWPETVSGQPYSLIGKCPCLPSLGNLGVSVFLLIFLVSLDLLLLYSPTRPVVTLLTLDVSLDIVLVAQISYIEIT